MIPVGEYLPDQSALDNPGATEALNVIPLLKDYGPFKDLVSSGSAASTVRIQGAASFRAPDGTIRNYCADANKIYDFNGTAWSDQSRTSGGAYAVADTGMAVFAQFGDTVLYANGADEVQGATISTGGLFADQSGSPPAGSRYLAVVRDVVVTGGSTNDPNGIAWTDFNSLDWTAGVADGQTMADGGQIMGLTGGELLTIWQEKCIRVGVPVASTDVFTIDKSIDGRGVMAEWSIATFGQMAFFLSPDGICQLNAGREWRDIGAEKWNRTLLSDLDGSYMHRVTGAIDPVNKLYCMLYPGQGNMSGTPNRMFLYNWQTGRGARAEITADLIFQAMIQSAWNVDNLDDLYSTIDAAAGVLVDDPTFTGDGRLNLAAFTTAFKLAYFTGQNLAPTVDTQEAQLIPGRRARVFGARPLIEGAATASMQLGSRNLTSDTVSWSSAVPMNSNGVCPFRSDARFHRGRITIPAGAEWKHIMGMDIGPDDVRPGGIR